MFNFMSRWKERGLRHARVGAAAALVALAVAGTASAATDVSFGVPDWPGEQVKAEVATQILDALGYNAKAMNLAWVVALKGVATGQISADMALWRPTQNSVLNPMLDSKQVVLLTTNVKDAKYDLVVPDYVWDAGVHSIADLHKYANKFNHKIYGIEAGNDGNELVLNAIKKNQYDLKGFQLVQSSEPGMLSQVGTAVKQHQWIVFLGWKPHWMNVIYKIKYLDDPELMWGGASTVNTVVRPEFEAKQPNVARFLKQMDIPAAVQSQWILDYGYKKQPMKQVASQWIKANPAVLEKWLDGVKTADGSKPAFAALQAAKLVD